MKLREILYEELGQDECLRCGKELVSKEDFDTGVCPECWDPEFDGDIDDGFAECWVDEDDNILSEAAVRMFKRIGKEIKRRYRCTTGPKKGKPVSDPKMCATRKDPKKVRHGRKVARTKKGIRIRKSKIMKRTAMSKMVRRMNKRLQGGRSKKSAIAGAKAKTTSYTKAVKKKAFGK